jgi:hypothetical protein
MQSNSIHKVFQCVLQDGTRSLQYQIKNLFPTPQIRHPLSIVTAGLSLLFRELVFSAFENHLNHIDTFCKQSSECLNVTPGGTYGYHVYLNS